MSLLQLQFSGETICTMRSEYPTKSFSSSDVPNGTESVIYKSAKIFACSQGKSLTVGLSSFSSSDISTKISTRVSNIIVADSTNTYDSTLSFMDQTMVTNPSATEIQTKIDTTRGFTELEAQIYADRENHGNLCSNLTSKSTGTCTMDGLVLSDSSADFANDGVSVNDIVVVGTDMAFVIDSTTSEITLSNIIPEGEYSIYTPMSISDAMTALRTKDMNNSPISDLTENEAEALLIIESKNSLATDQVNFVVDNCLEVPNLSTELESGTCLISYDSTSDSNILLSDASAEFITAGVTENDLVKVDGGVYKVNSVTDATNLVLKTGPTTAITEATSYTLVNSLFMAQFEYLKTN